MLIGLDPKIAAEVRIGQPSQLVTGARCTRLSSGTRNPPPKFVRCGELSERVTASAQTKLAFMRGNGVTESDLYSRTEGNYRVSAAGDVVKMHDSEANCGRYQNRLAQDGAAH